jgi:hypothetical protein
MKTNFLQLQKLLAAAIILSLSIGFSSCDNKTEVSAAYYQAGKPIDASTTGGAVKGTMLANTTYRITTDLIVNPGDTLVIQPGVKIYMGAADPLKNAGNSVTNLIVHGTLLSLGTKEKPIYITAENVAKTDSPGAPVSDANGVIDPAYKGFWGGILGDTDTKLMVIKWTHVEFGCGKLATSPVTGITNGNPAYMISFINTNGVFILEDSWVYGGVDDPIRIQGGKFNVMRNTFEKGGLFGGESLNIKSGCVGNYAYNVTIGSATNGPKASNKGGNGPTDVYMYNNTIVNSGFRRDKPGRGGSLNFEEGAKGKAYNNIMVNCKYGLRILTADKGSSSQYSNNPLSPSDFTDNRIQYGNNLYYADNVDIANQIYPVESGTGIPTGANADIPSFTTLGIALTSTNPLSKSIVTVYDGTKAAQAAGTNPLFKTFTLPASGKPSDISYATGFDFNLQSGSPAIGKGFTGFTPQQMVPLSDNFGSSGITPPNKDLGAYPTDGNGNKH